MILTKDQFKKDFVKKMMKLYAQDVENSTTHMQYFTLGYLLKEYISEGWAKTTSRYKKYGEKQVYYFSIEFLLGRLLASNLLNLGIRETAKEALAEMGIRLTDIEDVEVDAGLGNGGLGRLAACFMDSMASSGIPGNGNGIRYKYGLFQQKIVDGYQVELPENWLRDDNVWEVRKSDKAVRVRFYGDAWMKPLENGSLAPIHTGYQEVLAVPYDTALVGYENKTVNTLRLWNAEVPPYEGEIQEDLNFNNVLKNKREIESITEVLYPDDSNHEGRVLRLKQEYFFVSAGLQSIVQQHKEAGHPMSTLHDLVAVHINDTHPAVAIPELMRILMDEEGLEWDEAWHITQNTMSYTNHTIMSEALEKWPVELFKDLLPRIYLIVEEIDRRFRQILVNKFQGNGDMVEKLAIISGGYVRMAHLCIHGTHSVNGVAKLHTEILKTQELRDFYMLYPYKFNNKTNGITHRRWLMLANPELTSLLDETIGDSWRRNPQDLKLFKKYKRDAEVQRRVEETKLHNKERLAAYIKEKNNIIVDPNSIFDVHVKRLHAYKRQLLNALHILHQYHEILENPNFDMLPKTYIFAAKAAPGYYYAKEIIKFINALADQVNNDPRVKGRIKMVFLENYGVSLAEKIIPASEVSEQISTTTKEASGTSNMKFMMNGAITLATLDGANVEILEEVGNPNIVIFGMTEKEVLDYYRSGNYVSRDFYNTDPRIKRVLDSLTNGMIKGISVEGRDIFKSLIDYNDEFFVLKDFDSYLNAHVKIEDLYKDRFTWNKMSIENISSSGVFSSDVTVMQYASGIWDTRMIER
ncbi:glycogen/starch/alpha-glucan phosphorylase [Proteiniclasticum sp. BAD-10]|uniref:Alpha-1,4 glucan phosphorylase n=1 Tax=Proteiniclasticum sediminis TaxID=2804028 RepID=A0A941HPV9_9CLOT|nr:glycogen/starch/alpha-glucan phosphorylase [Proteiniclasticum sediminis]MBR0574798.1 glycogen/starch/alpha-glucan phosphorylase [Proteiniclasticum sediminis]